MGFICCSLETRGFCCGIVVMGDCIGSCGRLGLGRLKASQRRVKLDRGSLKAVKILLKGQYRFWYS